MGFGMAPLSREDAGWRTTCGRFNATLQRGWSRVEKPGGRHRPLDDEPYQKRRVLEEEEEMQSPLPRLTLSSARRTTQLPPEKGTGRNSEGPGPAPQPVSPGDRLPFWLSTVPLTKPCRKLPKSRGNEH